jgi:phthalate 4,5-dioxygenase
MLTQEQNHLLTQCGPQAPMGQFMRSFWIPAMTAAQVPGADEAPVRLTLLSERLVVFRDTQGRVGVMEENCPHRGASLFFGRNEEGGLRCVYHGWKFDVNGNCLNMPTEPATSRMCQLVKARAYPAQIAGAVLWVYMGNAPKIPELQLSNLSDSLMTISMPHGGIRNAITLRQWKVNWTALMWVSCTKSSTKPTLIIRH